MRSLLEQAVIHHLNGDGEKAQELFHQFIVARARQIHESMRNGEDTLAEGWEDKITSEEYFTESDLDELESLEDDNVDGDDDAAADFDADGEMADADADAEVEMGGEDEASDELGGDLGLDDEEMGAEAPEGEVAELEARVEDLEAELERLVAQFDEENGMEDAEMAGDLEDDMAPAAPEGEEPFKESEEMEDEDFEGLGESIASELEKVASKTADATEVGTGKKIGSNDKSGLPQKNAAARQGGSPIHLKSTNHKGFEREAAPAVTTQKPRRNNVPSSDAALSAVAAPSNKKEATEVGASGKKVSAQTKSPVNAAKGVQK